MQASVSYSLPRSNRSNSPFRYAGGKFYARRLILDEVPEHSFYSEPFAGGASVFFAKPKCSHNILNDLDEDVINTFLVIRDNVEDLINSLHGIPATKENHHWFKNHFDPKTDIDRAKRWFYLNRTSYSGIMKPENCYWGYGEKYSMRPENWPPHLRTVSDKLQGVSLETKDFEESIDNMPDGSFLFVDPPYYNADQQKFYNCHFLTEDHERLAACLYRNSDRLKFLLTYDDHEDVRDLYHWVQYIREREWNYTINRTDNQREGLKLKDGFRSSRGKGKEVFIRNYNVG